MYTCIPKGVTQYYRNNKQQFLLLKKDELEKNPIDPSKDKFYKKLRSQLQEHIRKAGEIPWQKKKE
jgi:hypothetical protein